MYRQGSYTDRQSKQTNKQTNKTGRDQRQKSNPGNRARNPKTKIHETRENAQKCSVTLKAAVGNSGRLVDLGKILNVYNSHAPPPLPTSTLP